MPTRSSKSIPRVKPKVAFANAEEASRNIDIKIKALDRFYQILAPSGLREISDVNIPSIRAVIPTSLRQFNLWDSAHLPPSLSTLTIGFKRNAPATLRANAANQAVVQKLVASIKIIFESELHKPEPVRLTVLRRKFKLAVSLREIAEGALIEEMKRSRTLQAEVQLLKKSVAALAHESREALENRDKVIASLKATRRQSVTQLEKWQK